MTLRTSLIITGDGSVAEAAVDALRASVDELAASAGKAAGPANTLDAAQKAVATSADEAAGATEALAAELRAAQATAVAQAAMVEDLTAANAQLSAELTGTRAAVSGLEAQLQQAGAASTVMAAGADDLAGRIVALEGANAALAAELRQVQTASIATAEHTAQLGSANAQLAAELAEARGASAGLEAQLQQSGAASAALSSRTSDLVARVTALEGANASLSAELRQAQAAATGFEGELQQAQAASAALASKVDILETRLQGLRRANVDAGAAVKGHGAAMGSASIASAELEHVIRAGSDAYAAGIPLTRIFSSEIGRVAQAAQYMGGSLGPIGTFLGGPWGAAFTIGVTVLAPFIAKLLDSNSALDEQVKELDAAAKAADSFGNAQSLIGKVIDLATGKLKTHNQVLIETIRLQAQAGLLKAREDQKTASNALKDQATPGVGETLSDVTGVFAALLNPVAGNAGAELGSVVGKRVAQLGPLTHALNDYKTAANDFSTVLNDPKTSTAAIEAASTKFDAAMRTALANVGDGATRSGREAIDTRKKIVALGSALKDQQGLREDLGVLNGGPIPDDLKPYKRDPKPKKPPKPKKAPDTSGLVNSVTNDIRTLTAEFTDAPTFVTKADSAVVKLDRDIAELQKRKPPNFQSLIDQATAAKGVIEANIAKPYNDYVKAQAENLDVMKLQAAGLDDQADALKEITALSKTVGPLITGQYDATKYTADEYQRLVAAAEQRRAGVLATVEALKAEQRQIDINRAHVALFENALGGIKSVVDDATQAFVRGDLGQLVKSPGKLLDIFQQLNGKLVLEKLFGEAFRQLDDQIHGRNVVKTASEDMAAAVNTVTDQTKRTVSAFSDLAAAAKKTAEALTPATAPSGGALTGVVATGADAVSDASADAGGQGSPTDANGDVVVTAPKRPGIDLSSLFATAHSNLPDFTKLAAKLDHLNPTDLFSSTFSKLATSGLKLAGVDQHVAESLGEGVGKFSGKAFAGAATGQLVSGIGNAVGIHLNQTGSEIGGALAGGLSTISSSLGFLGGPLGAIGGSLLGGVLGSLFAPKAHPGGATVSAVNGSAAVAGTVGSDKEGIATGKSLGGDVASGLNNIIQQLGGTLGNFDVEIGSYKKDLRVNTNGRALGGVSGSGAVSFGDDQAAAISYAIAQAVAQGAVKGIDDKVAAALRSSTNIDDALKEAMSVENLETWIGGVQGTFDKAFKDYQAQAADRLRIATQYGFDVVAVEKKNDAERLALADQLAKQQVGSIQTLVDSITQGDLFEGSAADKIKALNTSIDKAKTDLANGVDGAGDTLANLYQQRLTTTKDAYGTAGPEYTGARDATLNDAQAQIAKVNAQIAASEAKSDPGLATTNAALDTNNGLTSESNDLLAKLNTGVSTLIGTVAATSTGSPGLSLSTLATSRFTELA